MNISFDPQIAAAVPGLLVVTIEADVTNGPTPASLDAMMTRACEDIASVTEMAEINKRPGILATRNAYKALGKDPNRYRPSAEALTRRVVKGAGLYRIDTLVDLINLVSLQSGYSIGAFDADHFDGDTLTLGVGREGEPYEGIGRGSLNIAGMPVYRDSTGGVGTPTSDNERTKITAATTHIFITINIYGEDMPVDQTVELTTRLLEECAGARNIKINYYRP